MIVFDVRCKVLKPIRYTDAQGRKVAIEPGVYRLRGLNHLVQHAGKTMTTGTDLEIVALDDGVTEAFQITPQLLAQHLAKDDAEIAP
jgi:hypothetical protein